ncbi:MAG TPA: STAS domain-containing protein [Bryobacteraceae bacterium]|nr:STAS domain-containing protein [Bryobacteraceae bacterium]
MAFDVERQDVHQTTSVITLKGKLMLGEAAAQLETLVPQLLKSGRKNLVFDLSGVTHIDSTGIGRFIDAYSRLGQAGGQMRLAGATGAVRDSFRVTRLDTIFRFFPTVEAAVEGLN